MQQEFKKEIDKAEILVEALGYMQKYEGDIVVIKYGGSAMTNEIIKECSKRYRCFKISRVKTDYCSRWRGKTSIVC